MGPDPETPAPRGRYEVFKESAPAKPITVRQRKPAKRGRGGRTALQNALLGGAVVIFLFVLVYASE